MTLVTKHWLANMTQKKRPEAAVSMSMGCVSLMEEIKKLPCFLDFSSFLAAKVKLGGRKGRVGREDTAPQCREALCSTLCFTFNVKREHVARIFGQTHKKVMGTVFYVNPYKRNRF